MDSKGYLRACIKWRDDYINELEVRIENMRNFIKTMDFKEKLNDIDIFTKIRLLEPIPPQNITIYESPFEHKVVNKDYYKKKDV